VPKIRLQLCQKREKFWKKEGNETPTHFIKRKKYLCNNHNAVTLKISASELSASQKIEPKEGIGQ
jgi:hypothetical protein